MPSELRSWSESCQPRCKSSLLCKIQSDPDSLKANCSIWPSQCPSGLSHPLMSSSHDPISETGSSLTNRPNVLSANSFLHFFLIHIFSIFWKKQNILNYCQHCMMTVATIPNKYLHTLLKWNCSNLNLLLSLFLPWLCAWLSIVLFCWLYESKIKVAMTTMVRNTRIFSKHFLANHLHYITNKIQRIFILCREFEYLINSV